MELVEQWKSCPTCKTGWDHYGITTENISSGNVMCKHSAPESQETLNGEKDPTEQHKLDLDFCPYVLFLLHL